MGGPVLRELLLPSVMTRVLRGQREIAAARSQNRRPDPQHTPNFVLPNTVGMCYLCHLRTTNVAYTRFEFMEKERLGRPVPLDATLHVIHKFVVMVNTPGNYNIEATLPGYRRPCGIFGCFPILDHNNWIKQDSGGRQYWIEKDEVVF
jgi:hypothetical protein